VTSSAISGPEGPEGTHDATPEPEPGTVSRHDPAFAGSSSSRTSITTSTGQE
jgi:hypothetical protein